MAVQLFLSVVYVAFALTSSVLCATWPVQVYTRKTVFSIDPTFISYSLSPLLVRPHATLGMRNLTNSSLIAYLRGLAPAQVRVGGMETNYVTFQSYPSVCRSDENAAGKGPGDEVCFTKDDADSLIQVIERSNGRLLFALNDRLRKEDGSWNSANAKDLMSYFATRGFKSSWALGNGMHPLTNLCLISVLVTKCCCLLQVRTVCLFPSFQFRFDC